VCRNGRQVWGVSINSSQYVIKVISSHRACVDVGTPRVCLQYYVQTNNSVMNTQRRIRLHFGIERHGSVPTRKTKRNSDERETTRSTKNCINPKKCWEGKAGNIEEPVLFIGPYFFEENGITDIVNSNRLINTINNFLKPELRRKRISRHNLWFRQDGTTAHTARASMEAIRALFPKRVISRFGNISLASSLTGSVNMWLFSLGIPQITWIYREATDPGRFEDRDS